MLEHFLPFGTDSDAVAKGILKGDVRSDCGGLVVVLEMLVASDLFVMDVAHTDACFVSVLFVVFGWYHLRQCC